MSALLPYLDPLTRITHYALQEVSRIASTPRRKRTYAQKQIVKQATSGNFGPLLAAAFVALSEDIHADGDRATLTLPLALKERSVGGAL